MSYTVVAICLLYCFYVQENVSLEEQLTLLQQKEEDMKSLQEELTTLEEIRYLQRVICFSKLLLIFPDTCKVYNEVPE